MFSTEQVHGSEFRVQRSGRAKCIAANRAVMKQFPLIRPANKQSFSIRNRIVTDIVFSHKLLEFGKTIDFQRN
jgi:hypothetical protein